VTLEQYAYLAQILGVIVVVAALIYLSIQVRQGAALLRSEARQAQVTNDQANVYKFIDHPELGRSFSDGETPSFEEKTRLHFWIIASMRAREHEWLQYEAGHLDETTWLTYRGVIFFTLGTERARKMWELSAPAFNPGFTEMVKELLSDNPDFALDFWSELEALP